MTHLSRAELEAWRDAPDEAARARTVAHLAACGACAAAYAALVRTRPLESSPDIDPEDAAAFAAAGYGADRTGAAAGSRPAASRPWRWIVPLAAAAALVAVVAGPRLFAPDAPAPVTRGAAFSALSPAGSLPGAADVVFDWSAATPAGGFLVEVYDDTARAIWSERTPNPPLAAGAALGARLEAGRDYRWTVSALDARGRTIDTSPLTVFRLAPR